MLRTCRIGCRDCGASAEAALEVLMPAGLKLRCLSCGGDSVSVSEPSGPLMQVEPA